MKMRIDTLSHCKYNECGKYPNVSGKNKATGISAGNEENHISNKNSFSFLDFLTFQLS